MQIMFNRTTYDRDPAKGLNEYVTFTQGATVRTFTAKPETAKRYARRYGMAFASPMDFWRDVVCAA